MTLRNLCLLCCMLSSMAEAASSASGIPIHHLPPTAVTEAIAAVKGDPLHFAAGLPTNLRGGDGAWDEPRPGLARWRLAIASNGASSLSLRLEDLQLPVGASLYWIGEQRGDVQGPYGPGDSGTLWLPLVRDARGRLEARMPAGVRGQFGLRIAEAYHGYRGFQSGSATPKGRFGTSEPCNIDSSCTEGAAWRQQSRSAVLLTIGNNVLCSGTLVNNIAQDRRGLILTANHCGVRSGNIGTVRAYFNVARPCNCSALTGRIDQNLAGATFLARDSQSDFTLFELEATPPTAFNPFYSGWDASNATPQSGVSIHHPSGDDKKIAVYGAPAVAVEDQPVESFVVDAWQVHWSAGTTEAGSSGAGLWNQNRRLVGVLSGGNASCANPGGADFFGRINRAWQANTSPDAQLRAHLAPSSSQLTLDGLEGGSEPATVSCPDGPGNGTPGTVPDSGGGGGGSVPASTLILLALMGLWPRRRT